MKRYRKKYAGLSLIVSISATALMVIILDQPIIQDPSYHQFIDSHRLLGIPNFLNVISNIAFLFVGSLGLYKLLISNSLTINNEFKIAYQLLFFALALIALGSAYYHLAPNNQRLSWDRLAMTVGFMSLFSIIIYEFISPRAGKIFLLPAILAGLFSVIYWIVTEDRGAGDLRAYILVAFLPVLLTPIILLFFRSAYNDTSGYWWLLFTYLLAKLSEHYDVQIFIITGVISGHSLKHLFAALGFYLLLKSYENRHLN